MQEHIFEECYSKYLNAKPGETFWSDLAEKHGFKSGEVLRKKVQKEREKRNLPPKGEMYVNKNGSLEPTDYIDKISQEQDDDSGESSITMNFPEGHADALKEVFKKQNKNEKNMLDFHGFDSEVWSISHAKSNAWNMPSGDGEKIICFQTKISIVLRTSKGIVPADIDKFFDGISHKAPKLKRPKLKNYNEDGVVLEVDLTDIHFGKISYDGNGEIVGDLVDAVTDMYNQVSHLKIKKVLVACLGDTFQYDANKGKTTTAGTPISTNEKTHQQTFDEALDAFIFIIDLFLGVAPVEFVSVFGNHSEYTSYYLSKALELFYRSIDEVEFDIDHAPRKVKLIGDVLLGFVHGNVHKGRLKTNFLQVEARELWGKSKWAEIHAGHFHSTHEVEEGGLIIRYLPSISRTDEWHNNNLFVGSSRSVVAFAWHEEKGLRQIFYSNVD